MKYYLPTSELITRGSLWSLWDKKCCDMILLILATAIPLQKSEGMNSHLTVYTADTEMLNPNPNVHYKDNKTFLQTALIWSKARKGKGRGMMLVIPQVFTIKEEKLTSVG